MYANNLNCAKIMYSGNDLLLTINESNFGSLSALDTDVIKVIRDDGRIEYYGGYYITFVEEENSKYVVHMKRNPPEFIESAINAIHSNVSVIQSTMDFNTNFEKLVMQQISTSLTDSEISNFKVYFPEWKVDFDYKTGQIFTYDSKYYRVSQDHTSQEQWTPGSVGTESLYYEIVIADDGIIVWSQPSGSYNAPNKGDLRHYPNADSPIYKSLIDGNAYSPDTYPAGWEIQE